MRTIDQFAKRIEQILAGALEAREIRKDHVGPVEFHLEDREISMPLIVDETTSLGLSVELPISRTRGDLSWLTSLSSLALENPKMGLSCLVFLFQKPVIFPSPIYALLDSLCADLNQNDLNMQCMPVASYGGWELVKPMSLVGSERRPGGRRCEAQDGASPSKRLLH